MVISEHISALRADGLSLAAAAAPAGLDVAVPSCPEWAVRDLVRHTGGVHRWAAGIVAGPRTAPWDVDLDEVVGDWPADHDLLDWYRAGHAALVTALSSADADLDCWTFLDAPSPLAMWARRQAHETAIHRVDAELAAGRMPTAFPAAFAADGVDELVTCFITRRGGRLRSDPPCTLRLRCTDTAGDWLVRIGTEGVDTVRRATDADGAGADGTGADGTGAGAGADCLVSGRASDLYLAAWNRRATDALTVERDGRVPDLFRDQVRVRW